MNLLTKNIVSDSCICYGFVVHDEKDTIYSLYGIWTVQRVGDEKKTADGKTLYMIWMRNKIRRL